MAKRARGSVRPGQRRPTERRPAAPATPAAASGTTAAAPRPAGLSDAELERAAQLEAQLLADEKAAEQARKRTRERGTRDVIGTGTIAIRAEEEYSYVRRDLKRIARIAVLEFSILLILYIVIDVAKVVTIGA